MHCVIFITCANKKEARDIARILVEHRAAACVNIVDRIESFFWWDSKIDKAKETLLIVKSKKTKLSQLIKLVKSRHSYEVPEIIALPITGIEKSYLRWMNESLTF